MRKLILLATLLAAGCSDSSSPRAGYSAQEYSQPQFEKLPTQSWQKPAQAPLSTFAIDVDTGSYGIVRGYLNSHRPVPADAVRLEELINYFPYDYAPPTGNEPLKVNTELSSCPWNPDHALLRLGLQARKQPDDQLPPRNLVFLLDVSGSMTGADRLGLLKTGLAKLVHNLTPQDHVAIVTYAGHAGVVLEPSNDKDKILQALDNLESGGSTNGEAGIRGAYQLARANFDPKGINRVMLCTDGDFNVGVSDHDELLRIIEKERQSGVFLTTLGVGLGNVNDAGLEQLADKGNGNYAFLDSGAEAEKVLVKEAGSTLVTVAKDVKIQVEFNPAVVQEYKLLGYENRALQAEDFNDDGKDAGEVGSGHRVTALYELQLSDKTQRPKVDALRYQKQKPTNSEIALVKLRYQPPQGGTSKLLSTIVTRDQHQPLEKTSDDFRFAAAVARWGMLLKGQPGQWEDVKKLAESARGQDTEGYRSQFLELLALSHS
ncbi:MAG: VWA domain-containing protein [Candidatus Eremiobacteraeota bacterium]|nr:VWA domain-containing protein [Candidatus Eremiobacteraeota bacterium]